MVKFYLDLARSSIGRESQLVKLLREISLGNRVPGQFLVKSIWGDPSINA